MGDQLIALLGLGGPVILVLLALSVLALSVIIYKIWDLRAAGVGRHGAIRTAIAAFDEGRAEDARDSLRSSRNHLAGVFLTALDAPHTEKARLAAEADSKMARAERGFRLLDSIAQIAPLLGLFGTVLGMISAFQALQDAGQAVDPSALAGGIWVALLTTAGGLAIAMPTTLALSWLESRTEADRVIANVALGALTTEPRATAAPPAKGMEFADAS